MRFFKHTTQKLIVIALAAIVVASQSAWAQQAPVSPAVAAISAYASAPINHYSGLPQIAVPLTTLPGRMATVDIGLTYHARGTKLNAIAGPVGLGWSLSTGGAITRVVKGNPDEMMTTPSLHGYCGTDQATLENLTFAEKRQIALGAADGEPDIFHINLPGISTKMFVSEGEFHTMPYSNLSITTNFCTNPEGRFTVKDPNGFIYYLGEDPDSQETMTTQSTIDGLPTRTTGPLTYVTAWYLTRIVAPDGQVVARFDYVDKSTLSSYTLTEKHYQMVTMLDGSCQQLPDDQIETINTSIISSPYLNKISSDMGEVIFEYDPNPRLDVPEMLALKSILVNDHTATQVARFDFEIQYFNSIDGPHADLVCSNSLCKRPYLTSIDRVGTDGTSRISLRQFEYYYPDKLFKRQSGLSISFDDHWGYNNYNLQVDNANLRHYPRTKYGDDSYGGVDRAPRTTSNLYITEDDIPFASIGLLKTQILPTGGNITYIYENNEGQSLDDESGVSTGGIGPGVRIKRIVASEGSSTDNDVITDYEYYGGRFYLPRYHDYYTQIDQPEDFFGITIDPGCSSDFLILNQVALNSIYDLGGSDMGYAKVIERRSDGASTEYHFHNFEDRPDGLPIVTEQREFVYNSNNVISTAKGVYSSPFASHTYKGWERGLPKRIVIKNANGDIVQETKNQFRFDLSAKKTIKAIRVVQGVGERLLVGEYEFISQPMYQAFSFHSSMDMDEPWDKIEYWTYYNYELDHMQLREQRVIDSDGAVFKTTYTYPFDYPNASQSGNETSRAIALLKIGKTLSAPIEVVQYKDNKVIGASLMTYKVFNIPQIPHPTDLLQIYPSDVYTLDLNEPLEVGESSDNFSPYVVDIEYVPIRDSRYRLAKRFNEYDLYGNVLDESDNGLITTTYQYDQGSHSMMESKTANGVTVSYTHQPLVGVLTETDPNGKITTYEYDVFGRLQWVKDHHGDYLRKYEYHYVNEQP